MADGRSSDPNKGILLGGSMKGFTFLLGRTMAIFDTAEQRGISPQDVPPIIDETGLEGEYEILLNTHVRDDWPALLENQLGLALTLRKTPTDILVIDSASEPSGN
jgi:uncharacterized protein (TIGR03435 family)